MPTPILPLPTPILPLPLVLPLPLRLFAVPSLRPLDRYPWQSTATSLAAIVTITTSTRSGVPGPTDDGA
jgi:hypothetical protein